MSLIIIHIIRGLYISFRQQIVQRRVCKYFQFMYTTDRRSGTIKHLYTIQINRKNLYERNTDKVFDNVLQHQILYTRTSILSFI